MFLNTDLFTTNRQPTHDEHAQLTHRIDDHEMRLLQLDEKISNLTKDLEALEKERDALVAEIAPVKQALAPIRRVPEDILREIFVACLDPNRNPVMSNKEAPVLLTQISSHMRRIALTTPTLWAAIHIAVIGPMTTKRTAEARQIMERREQAVQEWLMRSGTLPLSISVFVQDDFRSPSIHERGIPPIMAVICKFSLRWKSLYFSCFPESLVDIYALCLEDLPLVESVTFNFTRTMQGNDAGTIITGSKILSAPKLTNLGLDFIADVSRFKNSVAWSRLTHINFPQTSFWEPSASSMEDVGHILRQTTCLVSCNVSIHSDLQDLDAIHLPFLKTLAINDGHGNAEIMGLLAAIRAPVLDVVSYNMTRSVIEYPYSLMELLKHSPSVTELAMGPLAKPSYIVNCLRQCPELRTLYIQNLTQEIAPGSDVQVPESAVLDALAPDEGSLYFCPMLENFRWNGVHNLPPESLQKFLEKKRRSTVSNLANLKTVIIEFMARPDDLDDFIDIQSGQLGQDANLYIGGSLHKESKYSVHDGILLLNPTDNIWPSKIPLLYLW